GPFSAGVEVCNDQGTFGPCKDCVVLTMADAFVVDAPSDATSDAPRDAALAATGSACTAAAQCAGTSADCLTWPGGYCTSSCDLADVDPATGLDAKCPGGGYCTDLGNGLQCHAECTARAGVSPCRTSYSCFVFG